MSGTPFDFMGGQIPAKEVVGLISFTFNLIIPGAQPVAVRTLLGSSWNLCPSPNPGGSSDGRGYILHTANGRYSDKPLSVRPTFYGKTDWGRMNYRITTRPDVNIVFLCITYQNSITSSCTTIGSGVTACIPL